MTRIRRCEVRLFATFAGAMALWFVVLKAVLGMVL
jgi:hypothetical protein